MKRLFGVPTSLDLNFVRDSFFYIFQKNNKTVANLNLKATKENTYDAIIIGSGVTGGWAAK